MHVITEEGQYRWATFEADWHDSSHILVAHREEEIFGFLRYVVQQIGPDNDCPPVRFEGKYLMEAKVLAFAVRQMYQRRGIDRALQERLIETAQARGLFQIRSHSGGESTANRALKLSLGFGVHPITRRDDNQGAYFILPLSALPGTSDNQ